MEIWELREKYATLEALRVARRAHTPGSRSEVPREALRALAARFPGALRELERLPLALITARHAELAEVARGLAPEPLWAEAQRRYHRTLRRALAVNRAAPRRSPAGRLGLWAVQQVAESLEIELGACRALLFPWE